MTWTTDSVRIGLFPKKNKELIKKVGTELPMSLFRRFKDTLSHTGETQTHILKKLIKGWVEENEKD